jgi:hypothetical protein
VDPLVTGDGDVPSTIDAYLAAPPRQTADEPAMTSASRIPFLFKQWGAHDEHGHRVGKGKAGRLLDGQTWDEYPEPRPGGEGGVR